MQWLTLSTNITGLQLPWRRPPFCWRAGFLSSWKQTNSYSSLWRIRNQCPSLFVVGAACEPLFCLICRFSDWWTLLGAILPQPYLPACVCSYSKSGASSGMPCPSHLSSPLWWSNVSPSQSWFELAYCVHAVQYGVWRNDIWPISGRNWAKHWICTCSLSLMGWLARWRDLDCGRCRMTYSGKR